MKKQHSLVFVGRNTREIARIDSLDNTGEPRFDQDILAEAYLLIRAFCAERHFTIYYNRKWNEDGKTVFDVGSHTEFFHLIPEVCICNG